MRNNFAITREHVQDGFTYLFVDTERALLRGMKWKHLGEWGKRKFENLLYLTRMNGNRNDKIKIKYV